MWRTKSNLYVVQSRVHSQFFHNYHLQIIKGLQPMINLSIIALYTWPFKCQSLIRIGIAKQTTVVQDYINYSHYEPIRVKCNMLVTKHFIQSKQKTFYLVKVKIPIHSKGTTFIAHSYVRQKNVFKLIMIKNPSHIAISYPIQKNPNPSWVMLKLPISNPIKKKRAKILLRS